MPNSTPSLASQVVELSLWTKIQAREESTAVAKKQAKKEKKAAWKQFELLVARIEEALAPTGVVVKSPDFVKDLYTDTLREVDATIRYTVGTIPILITVECRDRSRVQDDTWIEQLVAKKEKIGAAKTLAVSSKGFSKSATKTALMKGIELRTVTDVQAEDVQSWCAFDEIEHTYSMRHIDDINMVTVLGGSDAAIADDLQEGLSKLEAKTPLLYDGDRPLSGPDLLSLWQKHNVHTDRDLDYGVESNGIPVTKTICLAFEKLDVRVRTNGGMLPVDRIIFKVIVTRTVHTATITRSVRYAGDEQLVDVVEFGTSHPLIPTVSLYKKPSGEIKVSFNAPEEAGQHNMVLESVVHTILS